MSSAFVQSRVLLPAAGGWVREGEPRKGFVPKIILVSAHRFQRRAEKRAGGASGSCLTCPRCERGGSREGACVHIPVCRVSLPPFPRVPALAGNVISS